MEQLTRIRPRKCSFDIDVPSRHASWYLDKGYEPFSAAIFRSACIIADVVIDIGAHVGFYSCIAASINPDAHIIAVEANPENSLVISSNAALNNFDINLRNAAFGSRSGRVNFHITEASDNCGLSGHPNSPTIEKIETDVITGTELDIPLGKHLVIKIDVEGHELSALKGLSDVLAAARDTRLLIEFNPKCILQAQESPSELLEWLWENNYRIFALNEKEYKWQEILDISFTGDLGLEYSNLWCIPSVSAITVSAVMHSAHLYGAQRSHIEVVEHLIGAGCMIDTVMPHPDAGLVEKLQEVGSSASLVNSYPWWLIPSNHQTQFDSKSDWENDFMSLDVLGAIKEVDPEVILTQTIVVPQGALVAKALCKPHIWWIREFGDLDHGLKLPFSPEELGKLISSLSAEVFTNSVAVQNYFFPVNTEIATVIYPTPRLSKPKIRNIAPTRPWTIGILGTPTEGKGQSDAIQAMAILSEEGVDVLLTLFGHETEYSRVLKDLGRDLGVSDKIFFQGFMQDPVAIYDLIDSLAITSRAEAFGRVAFEATDAGVPIVYSQSGGLIEFMVPGITGLPYSNGNIQELANAIKMLALNPELGLQLVKGAKDHYENFRNDQIGKNLLVKKLRALRNGHPS